MINTRHSFKRGDTICIVVSNQLHCGLSHFLLFTLVRAVHVHVFKIIEGVDVLDM